MIPVLGLTVLLAIAIPLGGCGSGGNPSGNSSAINNADGSFSTCETEARAMPYVQGMMVTSASGGLTVKLLRSVPGPPVKGTNTWTVEVDQADTGAALDGLTIAVDPYMPDHMHGTNPVLVTPGTAAGTYTMNPLYLYMSGYWEVRMTLAGATAVDAGTDDATIRICIP
jgi:hypothetical protein